MYLVNFISTDLYAGRMNWNLTTITMRVMTVVLSLCGQIPSTSIENQMSVLDRVKNVMNVCTNNRVNIIPVIWPNYVDICPTSGLYTCDTNAIIEQVRSQVTSNEPYMVYILPKEIQCSFAGLGTVGPCNRNTQCNVWINGYYANYTEVYLHELGHNLGLGHSKYNGYSYGDLTDAMGACCTERCFNAVHLNMLRIKSPKKIIQYPLDEFKTYNLTLGPNEYITLISNAKREQRYFLQNRQNNGYDQVPKTFGTGLNLYIEHIKQPDTSELLVMFRNIRTAKIDNGVSLTITRQYKGSITLAIHK